MFAALPLLGLPVLICNLIAFTRGPDGTDSAMSTPIFTIDMPTGASWMVGLGDLLIAVSLLVLFVELLKSTVNRRIAIINQALSIILFIVCLIEFLLTPAFATSTFFLITLMAGFIATIMSAQRGVDLEPAGD